jgi:SAM-dependent methyltransferase
VLNNSLDPAAMHLSQGKKVTSGLKNLIKKAIPPSGRLMIKRLLARPRPGTLDFGSFARLKPISTDWGFDRGLPIDRFYIEKFLSTNSSAIAGHVIEIADRRYTLKFGGNRVTRSDVLHFAPGNPEATVVADLTNAPGLPADSFDCMILTQTLNFIFDVRAALATIHRIMKPGGIVLVTVAGISQISQYDVENWGDFWRFTSYSLKRLCLEAGQWQEVDVRTWGNVLSSAGFLYGVASEELSPTDLEHSDPRYQLIISARLRK